MKAVILAGGYGTRLSEETSVRPKPMVEVGGLPVLWHIMKIYSHYGIDDFVICAGYRGEVIFEWFANHRLRDSRAVTFDLGAGTIEHHGPPSERWKVTVVDTGQSTMTGGRMLRAREYLGDETFCMTYGDGVADVDLSSAIEFHRCQSREATMTVVQTPSRFGAVMLQQGQSRIDEFVEKPESAGGWINGGFFVLEPAIFDRLEGDETVWELDPLRELARDGQLAAYRHHGFWQPMDTLRDKMTLEKLWQTGDAPWKCW